MADVIALFGGRSEIGLEVALRLAPGASVALAVRPGTDAGDGVRMLREAGQARREQAERHQHGTELLRRPHPATSREPAPARERGDEEQEG